VILVATGELVAVLGDSDAEFDAGWEQAALVNTNIIQLREM
jgi:hypothetical protein